MHAWPLLHPPTCPAWASVAAVEVLVSCEPGESDAEEVGTDGASQQPVVGELQGGASERGGRGEHRARLVSRQLQVTDISLAARDANLEAVAVHLRAARGEAVLQSHAALGHRHAVAAHVHHVERVAVSGVSRTVHVGCPTIAFVVICSIFACEALKSPRIRC